MNEFRIFVADGQPLCRFGLCSPLGLTEDGPCTEQTGRTWSCFAVSLSMRLIHPIFFRVGNRGKKEGPMSAQAIARLNPEPNLITQARNGDFERFCLLYERTNHACRRSACG